MTSTTSQAPIYNFNFFINNNLNFNTNDIMKSKQSMFEQNLAPSTNENKEYVKRPFKGEVEEKPFGTKGKLFLPSYASEESLAQTEASTPKASIKLSGKNSIEHEPRIQLDDTDSMIELLGYTFLIGSFVFFVVMMFCLFGSSIVGKTGHLILDFLMEDNYYCYLVVLLVPLSVILTYLNWLSLKFFRHT